MAQAKAGDFGFSMTYPRDNPWGISYEPWHWAKAETRVRLAPAIASRIKISRLAVDTQAGRLDNSRLVSAEGYSSGQRGQTVNLLAMPT